MFILASSASRREVPRSWWEERTRVGGVGRWAELNFEVCTVSHREINFWRQLPARVARQQPVRDSPQHCPQHCAYLRGSQGKRGTRQTPTSGRRKGISSIMAADHIVYTAGRAPERVGRLQTATKHDYCSGDLTRTSEPALALICPQSHLQPSGLCWAKTGDTVNLACRTHISRVCSL